MTPELRAAMERLRRIEAGESYYEVYGCQPTGHGHMQRDERKLVDAFMAEHPADDDETVTEEWLGRVGGVKSSEYAKAFRRAGSDDLYFFYAGRNPFQSGLTRFFKMPVVETRGDVRRLCVALGIELKEPAK